MFFHFEDLICKGEFTYESLRQLLSTTRAIWNCAMPFPIYYTNKEIDRPKAVRDEFGNLDNFGVARIKLRIEKYAGQILSFLSDKESKFVAYTTLKQAYQNITTMYTRTSFKKLLKLFVIMTTGFELVDMTPS